MKKCDGPPARNRTWDKWLRRPLPGIHQDKGKCLRIVAEEKRGLEPHTREGAYCFRGSLSSQLISLPYSRKAEDLHLTRRTVRIAFQAISALGEFTFRSRSLVRTAGIEPAHAGSRARRPTTGLRRENRLHARWQESNLRQPGLQPGALPMSNIEKRLEGRVRTCATWTSSQGSTNRVPSRCGDPNSIAVEPIDA